MVVHEIHDEVWEPGVVSACLEQLVEEFLALLSKVVSEYFEAHEGLVLS